MNVKAIPFALAIATLAGPAVADDGFTMSSSVQPTFGGGKLEGCQTVFAALHHDPEYFGNDLVMLSGSVLIAQYPGKAPAMLVKLGVARAEGGSALQFRAPSNAYLVEGLKTNVADKLTVGASDTPGHALFGFVLGEDSLTTLTPLIRDGKLRLAYSMEGGGMGSQFVIDLAVSNTVDGKQVRDEAALGRLQDCFLALPFPKD